jgi:hypothetical protein
VGRNRKKDKIFPDPHVENETKDSKWQSSSCLMLSKLRGIYVIIKIMYLGG